MKNGMFVVQRYVYRGETGFTVGSRTYSLADSSFLMNLKSLETYGTVDECRKFRGRGTRVSPQIWNLPGKLIVSKSKIPLR